MSMSENTFWELKAFKPHLKLKLGDVVFYKEDPKKTAMVVTHFLPIGSSTNKKADYICKYISKQGKPKQNSFEEKELLKKEPCYQTV